MSAAAAASSSFFSATTRFERRSPVHWLLPAYRRAEGLRLHFRSAWFWASADSEAVLDFNQNAGCGIFGHSPAAAVSALETVLVAGTPLRLPLARCAAEEALAARLCTLAAPAIGGDYSAVLGMRSGAEALDAALALALTVARPNGASLAPGTGGNPRRCRLMIIALHGSFHGNLTRAAFSASAVFRSHPQASAARPRAPAPLRPCTLGPAASLVEYDVRYVSHAATASEIDDAFEAHDRGAATCLAVVFEAEQHFARLASLTRETAAALEAAARARGVPTIADAIWSGVYRTGGFVGLEGLQLTPSIVVLGKGLSASMVKHAALLVHRGVLPRDGVAADAPRPVEPCALCCAVALGCLGGRSPSAVAARAESLQRLVVEQLGGAASGWLRPVAGRGYTYEFELGATAAATSGCIGAAISACCLLQMLWWSGVLLLPRPLRAPRRYHAEMGLDVTDDDVRRLFAALRSAARLAAVLSALLAPLGLLLSLLSSATSILRPPASPGPAAAHDAPCGAGDALAEPRLGAAHASEATHRALLARASQLPVYARAHAELLYTHAALAAAATHHGDEAQLQSGVAAGRGPAGAEHAVVDCCADRSLGVFGHHHPAHTEALRGFVGSCAPAMPFGLLFMKPTAQALTAALERMAEEAHTSGAVPRWRARLVLSSTDANEAAVRLCLVRWEKGQPRRAKGPRQTTAASTEHPGVASAGLAEGAKAAAVGVPVVLVIGPGLAHGSSWMLRGLPVAGVRLEVISDASACSSATLRTALEAHAHGSIACALYEPVCSQTGRVLRPAQAEALREVSSELGFPLIADETRCGLGRCGDMLTSPRLGLAASLYTLGEALGGGYASVAAVLYDPSRFNGPFPSTATMANDNLGSHMGLAVLGSLVRSLPSIRAAGLSFEASVREALSPLADERCGVCDVAGRGLLLCVSFRQRAREGLAAAAADSAARRGWPPSLILHSYLLETHGVRARPSGAAGAAALVVEPPAVASDASGRRVCVALRSLAEMLDAGRYAEVCAEAKARRRGPM